MAFANNPKFYRAADGGLPIVRSYLEADSQSFLKGQLVYLVPTAANGAVTVATDGGQVLGIALKDATNVTSGHTSIPVMILRPNDEIKIKCYSTATLTRPTVAALGVGYQTVTNSNIAALNLGSASTNCLTITKLLYEDDQSTISYWAIATLTPAISQYATGS